AIVPNGSGSPGTLARRRPSSPLGKIPPDGSLAQSRASDEPSNNDKSSKSDSAGVEHCASGGNSCCVARTRQKFWSTWNCSRNAYVLRMPGSTKAMLLGKRAQVAVERALAEFRSGRPVLITSATDAITALPVDGMTQEMLVAFR